MKKTSKLLSLLLAAALIIGVTPVMALAENVSFAADEARATALRNEAWNVLEKVESEMLAEKAAPEDVVKAAFEAALNCELITDVEWKDDNGFQFRVNDMACAYDYRIRNTQHQPVVTDDTIRAIAGEHTTKAINTSSNLNVLLIGPCYSTDSSFTDEYKTRAAAIAEYTGGTVTQLLNSNASATNIVNNFPNNGVVIFDSHGASYNSTSYLCLKTSTGISSSDYNNNWALNFGSGTYGIDGRFIANYISETLPNSIVWMAICEGMKTNVFGNYLTGAGAGVVYGYSQSVSFTGDYAFEKVFWQNMTNGATVASAISAMKSSCGNYDYRTDPYAYPVVVSATDSYPSNPDSVQTVTSDWVLPTASAEPVAVTSINIPETLEVAEGATSTIALTVNPSNANDYTTAWSSDNTAIATVDSNGKVTGIATGTTTITCTVTDNVLGSTFTDICTVTVTAFEGYLVADQFEDGGEYIIVASDAYAVSNNTVGTTGYYLSPVSVTISGDECQVASTVNVNEILWKAEGNTTDGFTLKSLDDGNYMTLNSSEYLYPGTNAITWKYDGTDLANSADSEGYYYLSYSSSTTARFTTGKNTGNSIKIYKKITSSAPVETYYTVTFKDWDGTVLSTQSVLAGTAATAPAAPTRKGYTFTGWDKAFDNVTADMTVTAQYTINTYTVTFIDHDGTVLDTQTVNYGEAATAPAAPTREGYTFTGWDKAFDNVTADMTVTAQYTINTYTVTFVDHDGTVLDTQTVNYGEAATAPAAPTREGYHFVAWDVAFDNITADTTVTAQYTAAPIIKMLGASYRTTPNKGIRFGGQLDKNFDTNYITITKIGMLIIPENVLNGAELTVDTSKVLNVNITSFITNNDEMYQFVATLTNLSGSLLDRRIAARAYVEYTFNGEVYRLYSDTVIRSYNELAQQ